MKVILDMPAVLECRAVECAYNDGDMCHAHAITIGHDQCPGCDTYLHCGHHCHSHERAGVGACKVSSCKHNIDFQCYADNIHVGMKEGGVRCLTYSQG